MQNLFINTWQQPAINVIFNHSIQAAMNKSAYPHYIVYN